MKRTSAFLSILALAGIVACACAGLKARENVLLPTMRQTWPSIKLLAQRGAGEFAEAPRVLLVLEIAEMSDLMEAPIDSNTITKLRQVDWPLLRVAADLGVSARETAAEIGPGVAVSLRERIVQFDAAYNEAVKVTLQ